MFTISDLIFPLSTSRWAFCSGCGVYYDPDTTFHTCCLDICPACGASYSPVRGHYCHKPVLDTSGTTTRAAWTCPVCGRGVAPWLDVCPCAREEAR